MKQKYTIKLICLENKIYYLNNGINIILPYMDNGCVLQFL